MLIQTLIGQPVVLGQTDCNSLMCRLLDDMWNTDYHERYTSKITKKMFREVRARDVLTDCGYVEVDGRPKKGDFLVIPDRFRDNVLYCYSPMRVVSALKNEYAKTNKVRSMMLEEIDKSVLIYRKVVL